MIFGIENLLLVTLDSAFMRLQIYDPLGQLSGFFVLMDFFLSGSTYPF
jgi:hypothetical protein